MSPARHRIGLSLVARDQEVWMWLYVIRFLAFLLILVAIADKDRRGQR